MAEIRIEYKTDQAKIDAMTKSMEKLNKANNVTEQSTDELNDKFEDQSKSVDVANKAMVGLSDQARILGNRFGLAGQLAGELASGMTKVAAATTTTSKSMKVLKIALASTGIGALVVALGSLVAYFTKTERGAQKLRVATAFLEGAMAAVTDVVIKLGENIVGAFENPQKAVRDLGKQILYYFQEFIPKAIDKVIGGFKLLFDAVTDLDFDKAVEGSKQLLDGITDLNPGTAIIKALVKETIELGDAAVKVAEANAEIERSFNRLKVLERELSVDRAKANAEIERQKLLAEDVTKSYFEREDAARKAFEIENELLSRELEIQKENVRLIALRNSLTESSEEDIQALADAQIKLAEVEQASLTKQIELNNKLNAIRNERLGKQQQQFDRQFKAQAELAIAQQNDEIKREIARRNILLNSQDLLEEERQLIILESEEKIREIKENAAKLEMERLAAVRDFEIKSIQDVFNVFQSFSQSKLERIEQDKESELQQAEDLYERMITAAGENKDKQAEIEQDYKKKQEDIENKYQDVILKQKRKMAIFDKANSIFQVALSTAEAIAKSIALSPLTFGQPFATIAAAVGAAQTAAILAKPLPKFEKGGTVEGPLHKDGGVLIEAEGGEEIFSRKKSRDFKPAFMAIQADRVKAEDINAIATGKKKDPIVIDHSKVVQVPGTQFNLDVDGFAKHIITKTSRTTVKQRKAKLFSKVA